MLSGIDKNCRQGISVGIHIVTKNSAIGGDESKQNGNIFRKGIFIRSRRRRTIVVVAVQIAID